MEIPELVRHIGDKISPVAFGIVAKSLDGGEPWAAGSGVFIAPYLGLTAKHVVEGTWNEFEPEWKRNKWPKREQRTTHFLVLTQKLYFGRAEEATWTVEEVTPVPWTDLALLRISPQNETAHRYRWGTGFLDLRLLPPPVGADIWVFGYPESRAENDRLLDNTITGDFKVEIHQATVTAVEDSRRDRLKDFPGFEFAPGVKGGGSGGPVVWQDKLCGIASVGWQGNVLHGGYAAALWPLIFAKVRVPAGEPVTVLQLMKEANYVKPATDLAEVEKRAFLQPDEDGFGDVTKRARLHPIG